MREYSNQNRDYNSNQNKNYSRNRNKRKSKRENSRADGRQFRKKQYVNIVGILIALLAIALVAVAGLFIYQRFFQEEEPVVYTELGDATLPQVAFIEEGYEVNSLVAYTEEMDILTMRDTISPLTPQGKLNIVLKPYENEITEVSYKVYSTDGTKLLKEETFSEWEDDQLTISLSNVIPDVDESLLEIQLTLADGTSTYYYTRVITYGSCNLSNNLDFVNTFHETILAQDSENVLELTEYLTSSTSTSNGTLQYVTQASSESDVTWGEMNPTIVGEVRWNITECSSLFVAVLLEYQVEATNAETGEVEQYQVEEFYRVSYSTSTSSVELKQYARTVNQILDTEQIVIDDSGVDLGITSGTTNAKMNEEETAVAFVHERVLYEFNGDTNELIEVFALEDTSESDSRYYNTEYDIAILSVDENGSIAFVSYGYMNRGTYEGQVGTGVYYYDATTNTLVEKAFISTTTSFAVGEEEMSQGMYYSSEQNILYMIAQGAFHEVDLTNNTQVKLAENIEEDSYVISDDGKFIACIEEGQCTILEFETGEVTSIEMEDETWIQPLGFLEHDFIYGLYHESDALLDEMENELTPMYKIVIRSEEGETLKTYETENQYIRDISILNNMITLNLVEEENEVYIYIGQDVITNNEIESSDDIEVTSYSTEQKQVQKRLVFTLASEEVAWEDTEIIYSKMALSEDAIYISYDGDEIGETYYAYAYGQLQVQSGMASDAIQYASANVGAVVNEDMEYVWRSGSRDLTFTVSKYSDYASRLSSGESAIEIVSEAASQNVVFYTGCTVEQMCYIINQEQVIAAKLADGSWVLLVGYTGSTMYYLDGNGSRSSVGMTTLDSQVIELVGDGLF